MDLCAASALRFQRKSGGSRLWICCGQAVDWRISGADRASPRIISDRFMTQLSPVTKPWRRSGVSHRSRAPDAAQRVFSGALQSRGPWQHRAARLPSWVPALRKNAAARPGYESLHFVSNCDQCVQEVLIGSDLEVRATLERSPGRQRLTLRVHQDQWNVIELPSCKALKWCFSAFHEPVAPTCAIGAALQASP